MWMVSPNDSLDGCGYISGYKACWFSWHAHKRMQRKPVHEREEKQRESVGEERTLTESIMIIAIV